MCVLALRVGNGNHSALMIISNRGKLNKAGRVETTGVMPALNPLLCPVNALFMSFMQRWFVKVREPTHSSLPSLEPTPAA